LKTAGNFGDLASAQVARSFLEGAGIQCEIRDEFLSGVDWQLNTALHGVRLQVSDEDFESAKDLLAQQLPVADLPTAEETNQGFQTDQDDVRCPACGSTSVGPPSWKRRMKALSLLFPPLLLLYAVLAYANSTITCHDCAHRFEERREPS